MTALEKAMQRLNRNPIFKFTSSIKLAVPLMLTLGGLVAYGTVVESNYNSDYAKLTIYNSGWFLCLLCLLFLNILNSTLSRFPWKRRHLGFVTVHLGLLTLLTGAMMTSLWGVDGQLRVREGGSNSVIVLPRLMVSYQLEGSPRAQSVVFDKSLREKTGSGLDFINDQLGHVLHADRLLPFASLQKSYQPTEGAEADVALSFMLRSQFFNVSEWLHSKDNPEMQLGPATLRLIKDDGTAATKAAAAPKPKARKISALPPGKRAPAGGSVLIKDLKSGEVIATWPLTKTNFTHDKIRFALKKKFEHAVVMQNKLADNAGNPDPNPALELEISSGDKTLREILFGKFPNFSLNKSGVFGYALEYKPGNALEGAPTAAAQAPDDDVHKGAMQPNPGGGPPAMDKMGQHLVEFHVNPARPKDTRVVLIKDGQTVGDQVLSEGQSFQTPWMGMKVFVGTLEWGSAATVDAKPIEPQRGQELPPSALYVREPASQNGFWLSEGDSRPVSFNGRKAEVTFGRETLELPFVVTLRKFTKMDYPGTETAMSFESDVEVAGRAEKISMNEPLKQDGFTVYQASYVMNENGPPDSIFSVNRDPGRPVKYTGSLILALGTILFTVTRSRWYLRRFGPL